MTRSMILLALGWSAIQVAAAQSLELVEGAAELELSAITFPVSASGPVIYYACESCSPRTKQIDPSTVYVGSSGPVSQAEFLDEVTGLLATPEGQDTSVTLFYALADDHVTRITLHPDANQD